jgi:hypothetical protein
MNWTMFLLRHGAVKMEEAGSEGSGALTGTGGVTDNGATDNGATDNGATDNGATDNGATDNGGYDWEHATADDYFSKVTPKMSEGVEFNSKIAALRYGQFCIDNKIPPEVLTKYLEMESKFVADQNHEAQVREEQANAEARKNFEAQGATLRRDFSPQQIQSAVEVLKRDFAGDKDFMRYATREMSNNPTLVKLLVNWADTHQTDHGVGAGNGMTNGSGLGFAARWTGKNIS